MARRLSRRKVKRVETASKFPKMASFRTVMGLFLLSAALSEATHICNNNDLTAFCLIIRQFRTITQSKTPPAYPQFQKMFNLPDFPTEAYYNYGLGPKKFHLNRTSIFTYQDMCVNDHVQYAGLVFPNKERLRPDKRTWNPYVLNVTQISVNGTNLRNWLHFTVKADKSTPNASKEVTGKMKMGFLIVTDDWGFPVGDFNHNIPCGHDCNCKRFNKPKNGTPQCLQAKRSEHVPCMFTDNKVITHPGMMMFFDDDGFEEIHATWHFAQSPDPKLFKYELHVKALVVEDLTSHYFSVETNHFETSIRSKSNSWHREGIYGWTPRYDLLYPTEKTVGGWDFFRRLVFHQKDINCHVPLTNKSGLYSIVDYNPFKNAQQNMTNDEHYQVFSDLSDMYVGARAYEYSWRDYGQATDNGKSEKKINVSSVNERVEEAKVPRLYFGTFKDEGARPGKQTDSGPYVFYGGSYRPFPDREALKERVKEKLKTFLKIRPGHVVHDRCACPLLPTPSPPEYQAPPPLQLQGRRSHVVQMSVAWVCLVPFGIFVSRFFKETYSSVFFLEEFWWYSIHVLCMLTALVFTAGGLYVIEAKREDPFNWSNLHIVAHCGFGALAIAMFVVHCGLGFFRLKNIRSRLVQILLHWLFGNLEYLFAMISVVLSTFIVSGGFSCASLITLGLWQIVQFCFFFGMELHHRHIDRVMKLNPKRSYLPPPVMRIFHENAPEASFRVKVLGVYFLLTVLTVVTLTILGELNSDSDSCFVHVQVADT